MTSIISAEVKGGQGTMVEYYWGGDESSGQERIVNLGSKAEMEVVFPFCLKKVPDGSVVRVARVPGGRVSINDKIVEPGQQISKDGITIEVREVTFINYDD